NGDSKTYKVDDDTTVRDQDGNEEGLDHLDVGQAVFVVTDEDDDDTAVSIVEGGPTGFRGGGPVDFRGRLGERGQWHGGDAPGLRPPFELRRRGPGPFSAGWGQPAGAPPMMQGPGSWRPGGWRPGPGGPR